jgi:hypothetical protein
VKHNNALGVGGYAQLPDTCGVTSTGFGSGSNDALTQVSHSKSSVGLAAPQRSEMEKQLENLKMLIQWRDEGKITQEEYQSWHFTALVYMALIQTPTLIISTLEKWEVSSS